MSSSNSCRMLLSVSFGMLAKICLVHWIMVTTFHVAATHANGVNFADANIDKLLDKLLFQQLQNNAANSAAGVVFPSSPVGPSRPSSSNNRQQSASNIAGGGAQPPSPLANNNCRDSRQECQRWAREGECRNNIDYMAPHCERSCGYCDNPDPNCKNNNDYCTAWYIRGQCQSNPDYMRYNCAAACKTCGSTTLSMTLWRGETKPPGTLGIDVKPPGSPSK